MRCTRPRTSRLVAIALFAGAASGFSLAAALPIAWAVGSATYSTRGVVKSFGSDRKVVYIAHEKIDGYMGAMTMSFEARSGEQLAGLGVGDRVTFSFTATDDGRRVLNSIQKE